MAYKVIKNLAETGTVDSVLSSLLNGVTISTMHNAGVTQIGTEKYVCYVVYE